MYDLDELYSKLADAVERLTELSKGRQPDLFESPETLEAVIAVYWQEIQALQMQSPPTVN